MPTSEPPPTEETTNTNTTPATSPMVKLTTLVQSGKLNAAAWCVRLYLILLSVQHFFLGGAIPSFDACYKKALIANAVVACIRLHQRIGGNFSLSKEHLVRVTQEDSAHYLFYSIIFLLQLKSGKITLALLPITLMAVIHAVKYGYLVIEAIGTNKGRGLLNNIAHKQQSLFRIVSMTEIMLMPVILVMLILGRANLVSPFMYYRYIQLRYNSQRNAYCRTVFYELRVQGDLYKNSPRVPAIGKKAIQMVQDLCNKLGTPPAAAQ